MGRLLRRLMVPVLGVWLLAGCAHAGSTAAIVNGVEIPDSQVVQAAEACSETLGHRAGELRLDMVLWAVIKEMSEQYLAEPPADRPDEGQLVGYLLAQPKLSRVLENQVCRDAALGLAQHQVLMLSLGSRTGDYLEHNQVLLNPRYGTWLPDRQEPDFWGGLSELGDRS